MCLNLIGVPLWIKLAIVVTYCVALKFRAAAGVLHQEIGNIEMC